MEDKEIKKKGKEESAEPTKKEPVKEESAKASVKINAHYMTAPGSVELDQIQETYKNQKNGIFFMLLELEKRNIL